MNKENGKPKKKRKTEKQPDLSPAVTHYPSPLISSKQSLSDSEKIEIIAEHFTQILEVLGLDVQNESIAKTPYRIAKMYVKEVFSGLDPKKFPEVSFFKDEFHQKPKMVLVRVGFISFCEHHFVPMSGVAYVAYIPDKKLIGLSKIPRIVRYFAKPPQLQERLTAQIADSLSILLNTDHVAVSISAHHYCVIARGVEDEKSHMMTNVMRGDFNTSESLRREFFESISRLAN